MGRVAKPVTPEERAKYEQQNADNAAYRAEHGQSGVARGDHPSKPVPGYSATPEFGALDYMGSMSPIAAVARRIAAQKEAARVAAEADATTITKEEVTTNESQQQQDEATNNLKDEANNAKELAAQDQGPAPQYTADQAIKDQQLALANQIYLRATGQIPSAAELMLNKANQQSMRQQLAAAASVRGGANAALVARTSQNNMQQASVENAQNAAILRAQEQQQAEGQLGQLYGQIRGQNAQEGQFNVAQQSDWVKYVSQRQIQLMNTGLQANAAVIQAGQEADKLNLSRESINANIAQDNKRLSQQGEQFTQQLQMDEKRLAEQRIESQRSYDIANKQLEQAQSNADRQFWMQVISSIVGAGATVGAGVLSK